MLYSTGNVPQPTKELIMRDLNEIKCDLNEIKFMDGINATFSLGALEEKLAALVRKGFLTAKEKRNLSLDQICVSLEGSAVPLIESALDLLDPEEIASVLSLGSNKVWGHYWDDCVVAKSHVVSFSPFLNRLEDLLHSAPQSPQEPFSR
jgi:hypothetical protein